MKEERETTPIDMEEALDIVDGDEDFFEELWGDFLDEYPKVLAKLKEAVLRNDAYSLDRSAHWLLGMLNNLAVTTASDIAFELGDMAKKDDLSLAGDRLDRLDAAIGELRDFVAQYKR